jgi:DNA replication and repair protein RecF
MAAYRGVAGSDHEIELTLKKSLEADNMDEYRAVFNQELLTGRIKELERGQTLVGPHRDDVEFSLNSLPTKGYASHGETWSYALALKLGAARLLREESVLGDPILILDDVFAELDSQRRDRLADAVSDFEQIFITAAVSRDVPEKLMNQVFMVEKGHVNEGVSRDE